jgi:hypothetical protein
VNASLVALADTSGTPPAMSKARLCCMRPAHPIGQQARALCHDLTNLSLHTIWAGNSCATVHTPSPSCCGTRSATSPLPPWLCRQDGCCRLKHEPKEEAFGLDWAECTTGCFVCRSSCRCDLLARLVGSAAMRSWRSKASRSRRATRPTCKCAQLAPLFPPRVLTPSASLCHSKLGCRCFSGAALLHRARAFASQQLTPHPSRFAVPLRV